MIQGRIYKYDSYINVLENWIYIVENISSVISKNRFQRIAIYEYGIIEKKLLKDLEKANIAIECVIDRSARNFENANYRIYEPDNLPEGIELIIITAIFDEKKIREKLKKFDLKAISLVKF